MKLKFCQTLLCLLAVFPFFTVAVSVVTINLTVLVPPPCTINNNQPLELDFGEILTTKVDGISYKSPIFFKVSCNGATSTKLKLQLLGADAGFGNGALQTDNKDLGIKLQYTTDGNVYFDFPVNTDIKYPTTGFIPRLYAIPVKKSNSVLTGGKFSAVATLKLYYQ